MSTETTLLVVGGGVLLFVLVVAWLVRARRRERQLVEILDLPYGERDVPIEAATERGLVAGTVSFAGKMVDHVDAGGSLKTQLEEAHIPMRPGEFIIVSIAAGLALGAVLTGITGQWIFGFIGLVMGPVGGVAVLKRKITSRRNAFAEQLPDALSLIASSLSAGHTFLRAIQMMCEESEPPMSEEFARVVAETRLGDSVVDALARMAQRLQLRDLDWVVQAIRIQQTVGGKLADLLHTLADFIRAREEVRREVRVLTAEGRMSAWVLGGLPLFLLVAIQVIDPQYMKPMFQGWGIAVLAATAASVAAGTAIIFRMVKIEV
ncbi:MAG TPA: type II secretion system F family protein [Acidimicrobiales bacterium]|nr:type II secretion system F family protein [Acidimicrobiales bacterium]